MRNSTNNQPIVTVKSGRRNGSRIEYRVEIGSRIYPVYFSCEQVPLYAGLEPAVIMSGLGAMRERRDMHATGQLSPDFLQNQRQLMAIFSRWFPEFDSVELTAELSAPASKSATGRVGSFFTGGVDSFYTFLKHRSEITDLVFVFGLDVALDDLPRRQAVSDMGKAIEQATGVRFIELETDSIRVFKDFGRWGLHGHGYGLGAAARHLADYLDKIFIPSSFAQAELMPWGSHPETDPLFSDERLEVVHDGCEAGRSDKVVSLALDPLALEYLRVCSRGGASSVNCSGCEKCLRTMTTLYAMGVLEQSKTFAHKPDPHLIRKLIIQDESVVKFAKDNIRLLEQRGLGGSDVVRAWQHTINRSPLHNRILERLRKLRGKLRRIIRKFRADA